MPAPRGAFDDESEHVGLLFAAHAAIAYAGVRKQSQLQRAIATRELIGQACGILMERYKLSADRAFAVLVRTSQDGNVKLRDVADQLIHTGELRRLIPERALRGRLSSPDRRPDHDPERFRPGHQPAGQAHGDERFRGVMPSAAGAAGCRVSARDDRRRDRAQD